MDLQRRSYKITESSVSNREPKYDIIDYGVTMDFQKKSFIEPAKSCPH